jgi:hypothetical protein
MRRTPSFASELFPFRQQIEPKRSDIGVPVEWLQTVHRNARPNSWSLADILECPASLPMGR